MDHSASGEVAMLVQILEGSLKVSIHDCVFDHEEDQQ